MNKRGLIRAVADDTHWTHAEAADAVKAVLTAVENAVGRGDKVSITGFGSFERVHRPSRTARNPSTGAEVRVEESWVPKFRPGSRFKEVVDVGGRTAAETIS
ncbi:HU family DNA-binding protein [Streptosporangium saharense]|uniref:DNA-binding protein HU-beta n=1 Tax=Streptosporangium saharense TaxID=1706840 RepID=A0A7W7QK62_9ACTN|nr:HU family DNA-binding protein [Streptosporangium saharense]MBB4915054.1 DNA-binding protein HU-beta [Streptosporangium saharense]